MEKIYIPQLAKAVNATETLHFKEFIADLETLTPVEGVIQVKHQGSFLEIKAKAVTIITLVCDRTLVQFNHRLSVDTSELIWLAEPIPESKLLKDQEVDLEDLVETLPPNGYFDPVSWLYEQLCLAIPFQKIAPDAPDLIVTKQEPATDSNSIDKRWAALQTLKITES